MNRQIKIGAAAALFSVAVWAATYISTKIVVRDFSALEISLIRFSIGLAVLSLLSPPKFTFFERRDEIRCAVTGVTGMYLYYFVENLATKHTYASNVSVIVTGIPLITSLVAPLVYREDKFQLKYIIAFITSIGGFVMILSQNGEMEGVSLKGDFLAFLAAVLFSVYTLLLRSVSGKYPPLQITRKTIAYGWIAIFISCLITGNPAAVLSRIALRYLPHFLFLGAAASGICFLTWAVAVKNLGAVRASQFIYLVPLITVGLSMAVLKERFTPVHLAGMACILLSVILSQTEIRKSRAKQT